MFCKSCGKEIEDNSNYCNYCGANQYCGWLSLALSFRICG
jgi:RNA polymerase subunit RPABC4/transcription elongation factor Spt4